MAITPNKDNFEKEVLQSALPVMVDFWAPWCGPCKIMGPIIEQIAAEFEGKMSVGKVNVDENQELSQQFNILSIPTIKIFKAGKIVGEVIGAVPKATLVATLQSHLS